MPASLPSLLLQAIKVRLEIEDDHQVLPDPDILFDIIRMDKLRPAPIAELIEPQPDELCPLPVEIIDISIGRGSEDLLRHRLCAGLHARTIYSTRFLEQPEGKIQERYGLTKDAAHKDVDDWISDRDLTHPSECMLRVHDDERRTGLASLARCGRRRAGSDSTCIWMALSHR